MIKPKRAHSKNTISPKPPSQRKASRRPKAHPRARRAVVQKTRQVTILRRMRKRKELREERKTKTEGEYAHAHHTTEGKHPKTRKDVDEAKIKKDMKNIDRETNKILEHMKSIQSRGEINRLNGVKLELVAETQKLRVLKEEINKVTKGKLTTTRKKQMEWISKREQFVQSQIASIDGVVSKLSDLVKKKKPPTKGRSFLDKLREAA